MQNSKSASKRISFCETSSLLYAVARPPSPPPRPLPSSSAQLLACVRLATRRVAVFLLRGVYGSKRLQRACSTKGMRGRGGMLMQEQATRLYLPSKLVVKRVCPDERFVMGIVHEPGTRSPKLAMNEVVVVPTLLRFEAHLIGFQPWGSTPREFAANSALVSATRPSCVVCHETAPAFSDSRSSRKRSAFSVDEF